MDAYIICHYMQAYVTGPYMDPHIMCHFIHAYIRWPYMDAWTICHFRTHIRWLDTHAYLTLNNH